MSNVNKKSSKVITPPQPVNASKVPFSPLKIIKKKLGESFARLVLKERKIYNQRRYQAKGKKPHHLEEKLDKPFNKSLLERNDLFKMNSKAWFSMRHIDSMLRTYVGGKPHLQEDVAIFPVFDEKMLSLLIKNICKTSTPRLKVPRLSRDVLFRWYMHYMSKPGLIGNFAYPKLNIDACNYYVVPIYNQQGKYAVAIITTITKRSHKRVAHIKYYDGANGNIPADLEHQLDIFLNQPTQEPDKIIFETIPQTYLAESKNTAAYIVCKTIDILDEFKNFPMPSPMSETFNVNNHQKRVNTFKLLLSHAVENKDLTLKYNPTFASDIRFQLKELTAACESLKTVKSYAQDAKAIKILYQEILLPLITKKNTVKNQKLTPAQLLQRIKKIRQILQLMREKLETNSAIHDEEVEAHDFLIWVWRTVFAFEQAKDKINAKINAYSLTKKQDRENVWRYHRHSPYNQLIEWLSRKRRETSIFIIRSSWKTIGLYCVTRSALILLSLPLIAAFSGYLLLFIPVDPFLALITGSAFCMIGFELFKFGLNRINKKQGTLALTTRQDQARKKAKKFKKLQEKRAKLLQAKKLKIETNKLNVLIKKLKASSTLTLSNNEETESALNSSPKPLKFTTHVTANASDLFSSQDKHKSIKKCAKRQ